MKVVWLLRLIITFLAGRQDTFWPTGGVNFCRLYWAPWRTFCGSDEILSVIWVLEASIISIFCYYLESFRIFATLYEQDIEMTYMYYKEVMPVIRKRKACYHFFTYIKHKCWTIINSNKGLWFKKQHLNPEKSEIWARTSANLF